MTCESSFEPEADGARVVPVLLEGHRIAVFRWKLLFVFGMVAVAAIKYRVG